MWGRISALVLLASALVKTLLLRLAGVRSGVEAFNEQYGDEGLLSVNKFERAILDHASSCTACGLCDRNTVAPGEPFLGMMHFVLSGTRSMPDYDAVARSIENVEETRFERAEADCPFGVPLVALSALVRRHGARRSESASRRAP